MRAFLLSLLLCAAPVPKHLLPPEPPDPIAPGYAWWFGSYHLQVVRVDGEQVFYRCLTCPAKTWTQSPCWTPGLSVQSKETTRSEARSHYQYPTPGLPTWVYEK